MPPRRNHRLRRPLRTRHGIRRPHPRRGARSGPQQAAEQAAEQRTTPRRTLRRCATAPGAALLRWPAATAPRQHPTGGRTAGIRRPAATPPGEAGPAHRGAACAAPGQRRLRRPAGAPPAPASSARTPVQRPCHRRPATRTHRARRRRAPPGPHAPGPARRRPHRTAPAAPHRRSTARLPDTYATGDGPALQGGAVPVRRRLPRPAPAPRREAAHLQPLMAQPPVGRVRVADDPGGQLRPVRLDGGREPSGAPLARHRRRSAPGAADRGPRPAGPCAPAGPPPP